jgi:hypothetical protein
MKWLSGLISWLMGLMGVSAADSDEAVRIQAEAVRFCGFLPTMETCVNLLATVVPVPGVGTATLIAKKICQAVTAPKPAMLAGGAPPIVVDGVVIEGEFIGKDK